MRLFRLILFLVPLSLLNYFAYLIACAPLSCSNSLSSWVFFPAVLLACKFALALEKEGLKRLSFRPHRHWGWYALLGVAIGLVLYPSFIGLAVWNRMVDVQWGSSTSGITNIAVLTLPAIFTGLTEELLFRGFLLYALTPSLGTSLAVIASSLTFAAIHLTTHNLLDFPWLFAFGLLACLLRLRTGTLWMSIGAHSGFQLSLGLLSLLTTNARIVGPVWAMEGMLTGIIALVAVILLSLPKRLFQAADT